jgi:hypothetical protein
LELRKLETAGGHAASPGPAWPGSRKVASLTRRITKKIVGGIASARRLCYGGETL